MLTYGAILQDLRYEGGPGLVVGFDTLDEYRSRPGYVGATVGRCANRIRDGHLELDGVTYALDRNGNDGHTLHGGAASIGRRVWDVVEHGPAHVTLRIALADGEMGFPGAMEVLATLRLSANTLDLRYEAVADRLTLCNIAHHGYWRLGGDDARRLRLRIAAEGYTETDATLIPTGRVAPVAGDLYDFRTGKRVGPVSETRPLDVNFCLSERPEALRPVAWVDNADTGYALELQTTEPGLQVFDGAPLPRDAAPGIGGMWTGAFCGLALEPQIWPDANHHPHFPQALLRPNERYLQHTRFVLTRGG